MKKSAILIGYFLLLGSVCLAQERRLEEGAKEFGQLSYVNTQDIYQKVADRGYASADLFKRLADSYYLTAQYDESATYYGKLNEQFPDKVDSESLFRYAVSLKAMKDYELSNEIMNRFVALNNQDRRAVLFKNSPDYLVGIAGQKGSYEVVKTSINSGYSDFGPMFYKDKLIFSSNRDTGFFAKRIHKWNEQGFLNLYEVDLENVNADVGKGDIKKFGRKLNTIYHESTPVFTKDGNTVYFTRNNYTDYNYKTSFDKINKLKLYRAQLVDERWTEVEELPFNSDQYSVAHPALSSDNKRLYFSSDMPGSFGESDLWYVTINDDKTFGSPVNLGNTINTEGRESFPFISSDNNLYFSSTGHLGLGGLDIFVTSLGIDGQVSDVTNLGEPANTSQDDFAFIIDTATSSGFLSSNRDTTGLDDDIYRVSQIKKPQPPCDIVLTAEVVDKETGDAIEGATVGLYDVDKKLIKSINADADARFEFEPDCDTIIVIRAEKEGYTPQEKTLTTPNTSSTLNEVLALEKTLKETPLGVDIGKILDLNPIYFNFDQYTIRADAEIELAKVLAYMESYPQALIDIRSHTDSRGDDSYNLTLSENRNAATKAWLISRGIDSARLTGQGYGETRLVNSCSNGVSCTSQQHQLNRRSEFILMAAR